MNEIDDDGIVPVTIVAVLNQWLLKHWSNIRSMSKYIFRGFLQENKFQWIYQSPDDKYLVESNT